MKKSFSRRDFLTKTATSATAAGLMASNMGRVWARPAGANSDIRIGVIGVGRKGQHHMTNFNEAKGARVVALCDIDQLHLDKHAQTLRDQNQAVKTYTDVRKLLDDKDIDAVVIAAPNHWHTLMTIWACQAGKDIYVEKPVCHDIWEGQRMLEAEKKFGRLIQGGTQNRSNAAFKEGLEYLRSGVLGEIQWIHAVDYKYRADMGRRRGPQRLPATINYDLFRGPAPMEPLMRSELHYDWHWEWDTGNGDIGNIAAHTIDNIRHIMGDDRQPARVRSLGGRFVYDDDGETPNELIASFDYGIPVIAEVRGIPTQPGVKYMDHLRGSRQSAVVQCEGGYLTMGDGVMAYSNSGERLQSFPGNGVEAHVVNFIDAVRNQDASRLNCPLKIGVLAGELFHMANLSYRSGFPVTSDAARASLGDSEMGRNAFESIRANLEKHDIDLDKEQMTLGSWMSLENKGRSLKVSDPESELVAQALFQRKHYRKPYVVPEKV